MSDGRVLPTIVNAYCKNCDYKGMITMDDIPEQEIAKCPKCGYYLFWDTDITRLDEEFPNVTTAVVRGMKRES